MRRANAVHGERASAFTQSKRETRTQLRVGSSWILPPVTTVIVKNEREKQRNNASLAPRPAPPARNHRQCAGRRAPGNHGHSGNNNKRKESTDSRTNRTSGTHQQAIPAATYSNEPVPLGPVEEESRAVFRLCRAGSALWRLESSGSEPRGLNVNCGLRHFTRMPLLRAAMQPSC